MPRHKNVVWNVGDQPAMDGAQLAALMDIRDELQAIRRLMECHNVSAGFIAMCDAAKTVKRIDKRLSKKITLK